MAAPIRGDHDDARAHVFDITAIHGEETAVGAERQMPRSFGAVGGDRAYTRARKPVDDRARFGGRVAEEHARAGEQGAGGGLHATGVHAAERQRAKDAIQADDAELTVQHLSDRRARLARGCARDTDVPRWVRRVWVGNVESRQVRAAWDRHAAGAEIDRVWRRQWRTARDQDSRGSRSREQERERHSDRQRPRQRVATRRRRLAKPTEALAECVERS